MDVCVCVLQCNSNRLYSLNLKWSICFIAPLPHTSHGNECHVHTMWFSIWNAIHSIFHRFIQWCIGQIVHFIAFQPNSRENYNRKKNTKNKLQKENTIFVLRLIGRLAGNTLHKISMKNRKIATHGR